MALLLAFASLLRAQGVLTVTPGRIAAIGAGTGTLGYSGDGGAGTSATLASPSGVAYDSAGDVFFADAQNHVVREITAAGKISTVAGTGIEGFAGDNGPATSAQLDTPTGVTVDASGNVYIADSHNQRIRMVAPGGSITTFAGSGTSGFSGDGAAATAAQLALPSAVAIDAGGNVYIADTNNQRIRKITGTTISTVAGDGEETFAGDGAIATAAVLDSPTGVAVDTNGNLYIADRHNQRVRMVTAAGAISTLAGSGAASFSGSFSGDGAGAAAAALAKPSGVSVDAAGNVYIADTGNQRIREVAAGGGAIATLIGSGQQGFGGDGATPASLNLNMPKAIAISPAGSLAIADKLNELVRSATLPTLTFASTGVGIASAAQSVTLANTGSGPISVATLAFTGAFTVTAGGTCTATPIVLAAGASCTENILFLPAANGAASGSVVFAGPGLVSATILLAGGGAQASTTTTLTTTSATLLSGQAVLLTALVKPAGMGTPSGTIAFYNGSVLLGTVNGLSSSGTAIFSTTALPDGNNLATAVYSGDSNFTASTSAPVGELVEDFNFSVSSAAGSASQTAEPGQSATFNFNLAPLDGPFNFPVTLSATGLPAGATVTFNPLAITLGATASAFTMTILTPAQTAQLQRAPGFGIGARFGIGGGAVSFALMLLPFRRRTRCRGRRLPSLLFPVLVLLSAGAMAGLSGCGANSGFFGRPQTAYNVNVVGTATGSNGATLQRSTTVTLTVQ